MWALLWDSFEYEVLYNILNDAYIYLLRHDADGGVGVGFNIKKVLGRKMPSKCKS